MTDLIKLILFVIEFAAWFGVFGYSVAVVVLSSVPQPDEVSEPRKARGTDFLHWLLFPADWALGAGGLLVVTAGGIFLLVGVTTGAFHSFPRGMRLWKENSQFRWCAKATGICLAVVVASHWGRVFL
jgi:hypothetical protein